MPALLKRLIIRLAFIKKLIDQENSRRSPDWLKLIRLKKIQLQIKSRIHNLALSSRRERRRYRKSTLAQ